MRTRQVTASRTAPLVIAALLAGAVPAAAQPELRVTFLSVRAPDTIDAGALGVARVVVRNDGSRTWTPDRFRLSYHWAETDGTVFQRDGLRTPIGRPIPPGETEVLCATVLAPEGAGTWVLQWDLVEEGVAWFSGASPDNLLAQNIRVVAATTSTGGVANDAARAFAVIAATVGHLTLMTLWVLRWPRRDPLDLDEAVFYSAVFGVGAMQVVLHVLARWIGAWFVPASVPGNPVCTNTLA